MIEACYLALDTDEKKWMVEEMIQNEEKLSQNFFGRFALRKCRVQTFKTGGHEAWQAQIESTEGSILVVFSLSELLIQNADTRSLSLYISSSNP